MKYLWSFFLVALFVDWLICSASSKDPGSRRRKNRIRTGPTTNTQVLELHDLFNGSTTRTTVVASTLSSSQGKPDVSKNEKTGPLPNRMTTSVAPERIEVIHFNNKTTAEGNSQLVVSADLSRGNLTTTKAALQRRLTESIKETNRRKSLLFLSSASMSSLPLSTLSSSPTPDIINEDADTVSTTISTTTPTIFTSAATSSRTVFTQRCPPELGKLLGRILKSGEVG